MLNTEILNEAFAFYHIEDPAFQTAMLNAAESISRAEEKLHLFDTAFDLLFGGTYIQVDRLLAMEQALTGSNAPDYITSLLMLSACRHHQEMNNRYAIEAADVAYAGWNLGHFASACWYDGLKQIPYDTFLWCSDFSNGNMINCGSLTYQRCSDHLVQMHIPTGGDLSPEAVRSSVLQAPNALRTHYGMKSWETRCESWLLSPQIQPLVQPESNIAHFAEFFDITVGPICHSVLFGCLYNMYYTENYLSLPEKTSLQKAVKERLLAGEAFYEGIGRLKDIGQY